MTRTQPLKIVTRETEIRVWFPEFTCTDGAFAAAIEVARKRFIRTTQVSPNYVGFDRKGNGYFAITL